MRDWWRWLRNPVRFDDAPVPVLLPEPLRRDVLALLAAGDRIEAVRLVRQRTHLNLLPAVLAVDFAGGQSGPPAEKGAPPPR